MMSSGNSNLSALQVVTELSVNIDAEEGAEILREMSELALLESLFVDSTDEFKFDPGEALAGSDCSMCSTTCVGFTCVGRGGHHSVQLSLWSLPGNQPQPQQHAWYGVERTHLSHVGGSLVPAGFQPFHKTTNLVK
jgi:hypothetical protein